MQIIVKSAIKNAFKINIAENLKNNFNQGNRGHYNLFR